MPPGLQQYIEEWLEAHTASVKPKTWAGYETTCVDR
ncbi:MAG: hypothetical protein IMZ75_08530 [Actinobacteria bacterium]|nr:hypothetical protein [Actinomycetota bacterium]